ncbi:Homeodomain-like protein, partial [Coemansia reversa NRRL 1564]
MTLELTPAAPPHIKGKRKRASPHQLKVLNDIYLKTAFPSTETRNRLARELGMTPRTVQIWFQNKRQASR